MKERCWKNIFRSRSAFVIFFIFSWSSSLIIENFQCLCVYNNELLILNLFYLNDQQFNLVLPVLSTKFPIILFLKKINIVYHLSSLFCIISEQQTSISFSISLFYKSIPIFVSRNFNPNERGWKLFLGSRTISGIFYIFQEQQLSFFLLQNTLGFSLCFFVYFQKDGVKESKRAIMDEISFSL